MRSVMSQINEYDDDDDDDDEFNMQLFTMSRGLAQRSKFLLSGSVSIGR